MLSIGRVSARKPDGFAGGAIEVHRATGQDSLIRAQIDGQVCLSAGSSPIWVTHGYWIVQNLWFRLRGKPDHPRHTVL